jgi:hypothetical protein
MLFDLTGRGRRRTVRVVYSVLALIFLVGFVGFGVGNFGGGGVLEAINGKGGSGGGGTSYESQIKQYKKLTVQQPNDSEAWSKLIHYSLLQAATGDNYNSTEATFTTKAHPLLVQVQQAWQHYLALNPHHPSGDVANEVLRVLGPTGLNDPVAGVQAMKIVIAGRPPSAGLYSELAVLAYQAKDKSLGEQSAKKALKLAPAGERTVLENYLAKAKLNPSGGAESSAASTGQTVTVPASSLPKGTATAPATTKK